MSVVSNTSVQQQQQPYLHRSLHQIHPHRIVLHSKLHLKLRILPRWRMQVRCASCEENGKHSMQKADAKKAANKAVTVEGHRRNMAVVKELRHQIHEEKRRLQVAELVKQLSFPASFAICLR